MTPDNQDVFVLIALTVRPENQQTVIDTVLSAGDPADVPGLRSVELFRSLDGTRVVNYAQWQSAEAYQAMFGDPGAREHMGRCAAIATSFEPHLYTVESVHHAPSD